MNNQSLVLPVIAVTIATFLLIRAICMLCKLAERKRELKGHIRMIQDPIGCDRAICYYRECKHIVEHYNISLLEVGFIGDLSDLYISANQSIARAETRRTASPPIVIPE